MSGCRACRRRLQARRRQQLLRPRARLRPLQLHAASSASRSRATRTLTTEIAAQDKQIIEARALLAKAKNAQKVRVADLFRLTKAMPDQPDEAGIVLELTNVARQSGIDFESIAPQASTLLSGYQVIPITGIFGGTFFQLP